MFGCVIIRINKPKETEKVIFVMNKESFSFVEYMIHVCANKWGKRPSEVYALLKKVNCIDDYLVPFYDVLHTQSSSYVEGDIVEYLKTRGVRV